MANRKSSDRLNFLGKVTHNAEQVAAKQLAQAKQMVVNESARLEQLEEYAKEYIVKLNEGTGKQLSSVHLENYQRFLHHLENVMAQQANTIEHAKMEYQRKLHAWQNYYQKNKVMQDYLSRLRHRENLVIERKWQKELDSIASDLFHRKDL